MISTKSALLRCLILICRDRRRGAVSDPSQVAFPSGRLLFRERFESVLADAPVIFRSSVFLSSTYLDLKFERRFVARWLTQRGFQVITMEDHCPPDFDWYRWSVNRARQCDVYLCIFTERVGTKGPFGSILNAEALQARTTSALWLSYQLERPFPDAELLLSSAEERAKHFQCPRNWQGLSKKRHPRPAE